MAEVEVDIQAICSLGGAVFTYQNDIWMRTYCNGKGEFDWCIGAGGAIATLRDAKNNYEPLIAPLYIWESTDRIFQWTWWDGIKVPIPGIAEDRYNITQGGNSLGGTTDPKGKFAQIMQVFIDQKNFVVEIYSVQDNQWYPERDKFIKSKISAYTRYQIDEGDVRVRRVFLVGDTTVNGVATDLKGSYIEAWTPMIAPKFDAMALQLSSTGTPLWWYRYNYNIPYYPQINVKSTHGYSVVYKESNPAANVAVGLAFGKNNPNIGTYNFNSMDWHQGTKFIGMLPGIQAPPFKKGTVIDQELFLLPLRKLDLDAVKRLEKRSAGVKAPRIILAGAAIPADLTIIVNRLKSNLTATGVRTNHLAPLIKK